MKIAIDARMYGTAQRGIGRYLMKLIEGLEEIESAPPLTPPQRGGETKQFPPLSPYGRSPEGGPEGGIKGGWEFTVFLRRENFDEYTPRNPNFKKALWDAPWYGWREQVFFKPLLKIRGRASDPAEARPPDIVHFPHWNIPLLFRRPFIVTIHDLELFSSNRTRENTTRGRIMYWLKHFAFRAVFRHAVLASRAIIVPSNVVREQILDMYPQVRRKVKAIYEAPTIVPDNSRLDNLRIQKNKTNYPIIQSSNYPIPERYALYVGSAYPHKNLPRLFEAWEIVRKELPEYKLVLVGREDYFWKKLLQGWSAPTPPNLPSDRGGNPFVSPPLGGGVRGGVLFYGEATDEELAALYKNAALLVQPSLEEGFSLPPLEALSFGTPVAVSDIPVHREILSEAAVYFDPHAPENIAHTIKEALADQSVRDRILQNAKLLLPRYSWRTHARETLNIYHQVDKPTASMPR